MNADDQIDLTLSHASMIGTFLFGAVALLGLIATGVATGAPSASVLGLLAAAFAYLSQAAFTANRYAAGRGFQAGALVLFAGGVVILIWLGFDPEASNTASLAALGVL